jgi:hypothetical protein
LDAGRGSARRRRLLTATILAALTLESISPVSPVAAGGASITDFQCFNGPASGGRSSNTVAWGSGQLNCSGEVGSSNITLQLQLCINLRGFCAAWQNWNPIMAYRGEFGPGSFRIPTTGVATQGGLSDNHMYRLVETSSAQSTVTGLWYSDQYFTSGWIQ